MFEHANIPLFIVICALGAVVIGVFAFRRISTVTPYLYANARIEARPSRVLGKNAEEELVTKKDLKDLFHYLEGTDYLAGYSDEKTARSLHLHLEKHLMETVSELKKMSPGKFLPVLDAYSMFYEARVLKSFFRPRFQQSGREQAEDIVFPVGEVTDVILQKLKDTKTVQDMSAVLAETKFAKVFSDQYESLEEFEVEIDSFVLKEFNERVQKSRLPNKKAILDIVNTRFDVINIMNLLKCIIRDTDPKWRKRLMVENKTILGSIIKSQTDENEIKGLVKKLEETEYGEPLNKALEEYDKDGYLAHFEIILWKHFKDRLLTRQFQFQLGPYPLINYIIKKEMEVKNIMAASKGIESGLSQQEIREVLV